ncbi:MAG: Flp pilus assembly protein CpaB [Acetobacteraceae bacterium]
MILRIAFFALMALGLTGFGTVAWLSTRPPPAPVAAPAPAPSAELAKKIKKTILVAARAVHAGNLLKPEDLIAKEIEISPDAVGDLLLDSPDARAMILGSMVRRGLTAGEQIRGESVMKPGEHGFLAAVLGSGMRAITIGVDAASGSHGLIWPGDKVDVILTQTMGNATVPAGRRVVAETVLRDTRVIAIDQQLMQGVSPTGGDTQSRTVTLEVSPDQAERLSVAMRLGGLSLSLLSATDPKAVGDTNGRPTWARDVSPALGADAVPATDHVVRIFQGAGETKEFKF